MTQIHKVSLPKGIWVDLNTETGIAIGKSFSVQNTGSAWVEITESTEQPTEETYYKLLTSLTNSSPEATVSAGSLKVWAKSQAVSKDAVIAVQEVL